MKMTKMLTVALLMLCAMSVQSRESITIGDYEYTYSPAESNAWARNYRGSESRAVVPSSISFTTDVRDSDGCIIYDDNGKPKRVFHHYDVTEAYSTFIRKKVTEVILPSSIKRLQYTFYECSSLTSVDLGAVEIIGDDTFCGCTSLASIEIPSTVTTIGGNAFNSCSSLSSIMIPSSVTNIGRDAFIDCDALTAIETPSSLRCLGSGCFRYCASLKSVEINGTDLTVEGGTFLECPNLETAILGPGITSIADGSATSGYEWGMFAYCTSLKSVAINTTSVMKLPIAMFYRSSVQTVSVAGGFAEIGRGAFYRCTSLETIDGFLAPITIGDEAFYKCSKFKGGVDFSRCEAISGWAFYECSSLTNVRFGPNLSSLGSNAFYGCSKLELVEFDGAPPSVGSGVFSRVKSGAVGTYTAAHAAEWDAVIDADGKWNGLIMKQLEPPAPPTLSAETADWTDGTITLRCEDANVGIANAPFYNLLYFDTAKDEWCNVDRDDLLIPYPSVESNGAGGEMLVTRITDKKFAKRNNGLGAVKYSIYDDEDYARMATCVTRNRHGLFVALDEYADGERLPTAMHEASVFRDAYKKYGDACGYISVMNGAGAYKSDILARLEYVAENKAHAGDVFVFYYLGHGGGHYVTCYGNGEELSASELITRLHKFPNGTGIVVVLNTCFAEGMISREDVADGMGNIGWIVAAQSDQNAKLYTFTKCLCNNGWFFGDADILDENIGTYGNDDGLVTFGELAMYGQQWSAFNNVGQIMSFYNSTALNNIVAGKIPFKSKSDQEWIWSTAYPSVYAASNGDIATAAAMTAANGCRTVGECYALGIDPEDPNDDLKITDFEMKDGKPVITLNHTEDGSGNSFLPRVKTLGKANLADSTEEWREVPEGGDPSMRFFKVEVEMP